MSTTKKITINLSEEILAKLDKVATEKFRGVDRSKVIRWLIEDEWDRIEVNAKENHRRMLIRTGRLDDTTTLHE